MTNAISSLSSLSHLQLHLHGSYPSSITDRTMKSMCTMLRSLITLSHLDLSFSENWKITDVGVIDLMDAIQSLQHLSYLLLGLRGCSEVTDVGGEKIGDIVRARTSLIECWVDGYF
eukprot:TRINITY_DN0_c1148_g1_i6.p1 TRINITY_DN0_c1148_g1~~TRINITY_DN0_c1148_g1_i6.p1  ORF type:complete len:116 (+),score=11.63 TRINITY_DN0_c1148_g1_i6:95-442(+)